MNWLFNQSGQKVGKQYNFGVQETGVIVKMNDDGSLSLTETSETRELLDDESLSVIRKALLYGAHVMVKKSFAPVLKAYWEEAKPYASYAGRTASTESADADAEDASIEEGPGEESELEILMTETQYVALSQRLATIEASIETLMGMVDNILIAQAGTALDDDMTDAERTWLAEEDRAFRFDGLSTYEYAGLRARGASVHSRMNEVEVLEAVLPLFVDKSVFVMGDAVEAARKAVAGMPDYMVTRYREKLAEESAKLAKAVADDSEFYTYMQDMDEDD